MFKILESGHGIYYLNNNNYGVKYGIVILSIEKQNIQYLSVYYCLLFYMNDVSQ